MTAPSSTTIDAVATHSLTGRRETTHVMSRGRRRPSAARPLRRALDAIVDAGALLLVVWMIPFVVLAISSPIVLLLWAVLSLIHRL